MAEQLSTKISCIILAGGQARRMQGEDKGLLIYRERPLIEHVIDRIKPQVDEIIISANRNAEKYSAYATRVIADEHEDYSGPLAGIATCLRHCQHPRTLVVACDMPSLPADLVACLSGAIGKHAVAIAACDARLQLAFLLHTRLLGSITTALANHELKLMDWINSCDTTVIEFADITAFTNLNTLYDLNTVS